MATFQLITSQVQDIDGVPLNSKCTFKEINRKDIPWISNIPLNKGITWEPTWKATQNDDRVLVIIGVF